MTPSLPTRPASPNAILPRLIRVQKPALEIAPTWTLRSASDRSKLAARSRCHRKQSRLVGGGPGQTTPTAEVVTESCVVRL